jgi:hypothetical protein
MSARPIGIARLAELAACAPGAAWARYVTLCGQCEATQTELLTELVRSNATSEFGRRHDFASLRTTDEFRRAVPISSWPEFEPSIHALLEHGGDVLTVDDPVVRYNLSSGTSGAPKLIPVTTRGRMAAAITLKLRMALTIFAHPELLRGQLLPFSHMATRGRTPLGLPFGSAAAASVVNAPVELARRFAYPPAVLDIPDADARQYAMARCALAHPDVRGAIGNNPLSFIRLFEFTREHWAPLISDIQNGTLTPPTPIPRELHDELLAALVPKPERAAELAALPEHDRWPAHYWPALRVFSCWKTGLMSRWVPALASMCGPTTVVREYGYGASEGQFSVPVNDHSSAGVLTIHGTFFEFLPEHAPLRPTAETLLAHELEPGRRYQLIVTTCSGLYRYAIEDLIEVVDRIGTTPTIIFVRKLGDLVNLIGEKIDATEVMAAMHEASEIVGLAPRHFQWIASLADVRYDLYVEPGVADDDAGAWHELLAQFEAALQRRVRVYASYREEQLIAGPRLRLMRRGWLDAILDQHRERSVGVGKPKLVDYAPTRPDFLLA